MPEYTDKQIQERFEQLPEVVRNAITEANVEHRLREISDTHKLHFDHWDTLEKQVMLILIGLKPAVALYDNILATLGVGPETAAALTRDISQNIFDPIRKELERALEHPEAQEKQASGVENIGAQALQAEQGAAAPAPAPIASQPQAVRTQISDTYKTGGTSAARKDVHNDPYRESPV